MTAKKNPDDDFMKLLEDGIRAVLSDANAPSAEKLKAIDSGAKLLMIRHKIGGSDGDSPYFR